MPVMRLARRKGRSIEEGERRLSFGLLERRLEGVDFAPELEDGVLLLGEGVRAGRGRGERHFRVVKGGGGLGRRRTREPSEKEIGGYVLQRFRQGLQGKCEVVKVIKITITIFPRKTKDAQMYGLIGSLIPPSLPIPPKRVLHMLTSTSPCNEAAYNCTSRTACITCETVQTSRDKTGERGKGDERQRWTSPFGSR
jgi:hypothetical protein